MVNIYQKRNLSRILPIHANVNEYSFQIKSFDYRSSCDTTETETIECIFYFLPLLNPYKCFMFYFITVIYNSNDLLYEKVKSNLVLMQR